MAEGWSRYVPPFELTGEPVVAVDCVPLTGSYLTISHWPSTPMPEGTRPADTSAEMAWRFRRRHPHEPIEDMSSNHFDADGLLAMALLAKPDVLPRHAALAIATSHVGDFRCARSDEAIQASCLIDAWCTPGLSPLGGETFAKPRDEHHADLYQALLPRILVDIQQLGAFRELWAPAFDQYVASTARLKDRLSRLELYPERDFAVIAMAEGDGDEVAGWPYPGFSDVAVQSLTECATVQFSVGRRHRVVSRYESWVRMARPRQWLRRDLRALQLRLQELDSVVWSYDGVHQMVPTLWCNGESRLDADELTRLVLRALDRLPAAWNPLQPWS